MVKIVRSCYFTSIFLFLTTTIFQSTFAEKPLIEMLRSCGENTITGDTDGFCIGILNVDSLSATDVFIENLSIIELVASGNVSASTITGSLTGNATTATNFTGSLVGDVTGTQGATVVATVGGQTAVNVAAATLLANAATPLNTASTIVERDASKNFAAGTITAALNGNATTATTSTNFTGSLVGDVTGTQGATVVATVGGQTAANVAAATLLANAATNLNTVSTIIKRDSTGSFAAQRVSVVDVIISTNLVLSTDPSTSTAGNIIKGSNRFIHDAGTNNTFVGSLAGNFATTGTGQNSAFGVNALTANTTGANNTAFGYNALDLCTTGSNNIAIGSASGGILTTGSNNIYMAANAATNSEAGTIRIGTNGSQTICYIQGISGVSLLLSGSGVVVSSAGQLGVTLSTEKVKRNIKDMNTRSSNVLALRPVTFMYKNDITDTEQFGLIAEEVEKVFPEIVVYDEDGNPLSVQYHVLPVLLLNEIKKQQNMIDLLQTKTDDLIITNQIMMTAIERLQEKMAAYMER